MSVLIHKDTKVIVQGITGKAARFHTEQMQKYGTNIVGGTAPGRAGEVCCGVPVFNTVRDAVAVTKATTSVIFVPAAFAADAILEAVEAGLELVVCITEHIPVEDMVKVHRYMVGKKTRLIGPNCPGLISVDEANIGIIPGQIYKKRPRGRGFPFRHADLRSDLPADKCRHRTDECDRHRRRPDQRHGLHRCIEAFQ